MAKEYKIRAGKNSVILGTWSGYDFRPIPNQKPGMVSPIGLADGMIVTTKEIALLEKDREVEMIPIKLDLQSDKERDFFIQ